MLIRIENIADYVGREVTLQGWVYARTGKGKLHFVQLRDGTGTVQCVAFQKEAPEAVFETARQLTQESAVAVTGTVRADERAPGVPGGYEVGVADIQLLQAVEEYPITPKEHGVEFLLDHRHLWIRSSRQWAILRVRATIMRAIRAWLHENGFVEISTPIITPAAAEGTPPCLRLTTLANALIWRRPDSSTTKLTSPPSAGCIVSAPPSAPKNQKPAAI